MNYKLPPLPFAVFDEFGNSCEDRVRDHFIEAIEAQGVPDVDDLRDRLVAISSAVAEQNDMLAQALIGDTLAMLASTPPAPQADKYVPCPHCGKNTASDNPSQWCPCPKQASVVQQEPVGVVVPTRWETETGKTTRFDVALRTNAQVEAGQFVYTHPAPQAKPIGWLYDWTHSSALGKPDEHFTSFTTDEEHARKHSNARQVFSAAQQAKQQPLSADRDAQVAELERELEKEKQYVKEMTKDRDHWMTVAAERALLLDKNRKVNKPLSDYEFDEIG